MNNQQLIERMESTYTKIKDSVSWGVDKRIILSLISYYIIAEEGFEGRRFLAISDMLKQKSGWFSPVRGNLLYVFAAMLDKPASFAEEETDLLFEKQKVLKNVGFRNTIYSYLAALLLSDDKAEYEVHASQAKSLFDEMKKQHAFLTSDDDYAYAVLLSKNGGNFAEKAQMMRKYYDELRIHKFGTGNELQWMSQIMTYLDSTAFYPAQAEQAGVIRDYFERNYVKVRRMHYPLIGFLTVFDVKDSELNRILELTKELEQTKLFKWYKDTAFSVATQIVLHDLTKDLSTTSVSMAASVELILQAQQTAMIGSIAAISAAGAAGGGGE